MNKLLQATVAAFAIMAVASIAFYGFLMVDQFAVWEAAVARAEPIFAFGILGMLIFSLAMALMYPKGYQGGDPVKEGARFGFLVSVLLVGVVSTYFGFYEFQATGILIDIVFNVVLVTIMGAAIGKVYGGGAS